MIYNGTSGIQFPWIIKGKWNKKTTIFAVLLFWVVWVTATPESYCRETQNIGYNYFKNYSSNDYNSWPGQNWCVTQDKRRIIYAANQGGVLEFDGVSWRNIEVRNEITCSIASSDSGTVYVGGINEFGYLKPDDKGTLHYESLISHLEEGQREFGNVWAIHTTKEGIYFQTSSYLFRWKSDKIVVSEPEEKGAFHTSFTCHGKLFINEEGLGLKQMIGNSLEFIPGYEVLKEDLIYMMASYETDSSKILIGTRSNGFYIYDGKTVKPFYTEADQYLKEKQLYHGIRLASGDFALATRLGGLVIIDLKGHFKQVFDIDYGLPVNSIKYVFEDFQGNLWLALDKGITKIEYASPFTIYDGRSGLDGSVYSVIKHQGNIYAGTYSGLYVLSNDSTFKLISKLSSSCFDLLSTDDSILAATIHGIFQVETKNKQFSHRKIAPYRSYALLPSKKSDNRIWVGTGDGLVSLHRSKGSDRWEMEFKFEGISGRISHMVQNQKGDLWLSFATSGVKKVHFPDRNITSQPVVTDYNMSDGLPKFQMRIFMISNRVVFASANGLFHFDEAEKMFKPDSMLGNRFLGGEERRDVFLMVEDKDKSIWVHSDGQNLLAQPGPDGTFGIDEEPYRNFPDAQVGSIYSDPDSGLIWFASHDGLIRYDKGIKKNYRLNFPTLIRNIHRNEELIFNGYKAKGTQEINHGLHDVEYQKRFLRFSFAAPFFEDERNMEYQFFLENFDEDWSEWTTDSYKDYTNLDYGPYAFRVRARNVYGIVSSEDSFQFNILPPWYSTWWALLSFIIAISSILFLLINWWRTKRLKAETQRLEKIVRERTKEINQKNIQLESQTVQLKEQSEKLKEVDQMKSRFFANISHEFRTPLTLLMGPLEQMIDDCDIDEDQKKRKLTLMLRNTQRLLRLINQLLELSKLGSGKLKLQAGQANIITFTKGITLAFQPLAEQKELDLMFLHDQANNSQKEELLLYFDHRKLEDIMSNLLVNAFKFTPAGGEISVTLSMNPEKETPFPDGSIEISVRDTGPGIPVDQLPHIFDRFYQADNSYEQHQQGSGIGLALANELVELHHGSLTARNHQEGGSEFIIQFPVGNAHLAPDEIVQHMAEDIHGIDVSMEISENDNSDDSEPIPLIHVQPQDLTDDPNVVLVVEDSPVMREYIRGILTPGYTVIEAKDGDEGIEKAREYIPDLIISDIMMPKSDGYQLCNTLKTDVRTSHIPIVLLTAKASEENIVEGLETGADDYVTKPFSTTILSARIKNLIEVRSQLQQNFKREMTYQPVKTAVSKIDREFLKDLQAVLDENMSDPEFNVKEMCAKLYMGNTTLYRKIQALCGQTPTEFIRSYRLKRAVELFKSGVDSVTEVAFEVGFSSRAYFTKCFKEKFHQLPSDFMAGAQETA